MRIRIEDSELRKKQILIAAEAALEEKGYHNILLDDVARLAGVSKGTLYLYFKDKDDLMVALFSHVARDYAGRTAGIPQLDAMPPLEQLKRIAQEMVTVVGEHRGFFIEFALQRPEVFGKKVGESLLERFTDHFQFLAGKIQKCIQGGVLKPHDPMMGALFLIAIIRMSLMRAKLMSPPEGPLTADRILDLFMNGLGK